MPSAICISCGARKRTAYQRCRRCGFDPTKDDTSLVKSVYLSTGRYYSGSETEGEAAEQARYSTELDHIAELLESGHEIEYDADELARLREQLRLVRSVPRIAVWGAVFRLFLPAFVLGAILLVLVVVLRVLRFFLG